LHRAASVRPGGGGVVDHQTDDAVAPRGDDRVRRLVDDLPAQPLVRVCRHLAASTLLGDDAAPQARRAPDSAPQRLELHDLAVVDEQVHLGPVVLDVPREHLWIGCLEHHLLQTERARDAGDDVGAPRLHVLGDALRFDHDQIRPGVEEPLGLLDVMKPLETSMMSKPTSLHSVTYLLTASLPCVTTYSMNPPVETSTSCRWHTSITWRRASRGSRVNEP